MTRLSRRTLLGGAAATGALAALPVRALQQAGAARVFTPEMFGAKGDGVTNDTRAFSQLAAAVNAAGGGAIEFRQATYIVGMQVPSLAADSLYAFNPLGLLHLSGCSRPLTIKGNGARLKCADGLRYGTFDVRTARPTRNPMPYLGRGQVSSPYRAMIQVENCTGPVEVADLELDGNVGKLQIGGEYGDTGRQIPAIGLVLLNNRGPETVRNIHTHHHAQDGLYIDGIDTPGRNLPRRLISNVRSEYNCRQGCSVTGGRGYRFEDCKFNHTGKAVFMSAPTAGFDIEAEGGKINRDFSFIRCEFVNNAGCGMVADTGDSEGATFENCTFVGTTAWAVWPAKPRFRFQSCTFVGASVRCYGDNDPARAAQFRACRFLDDPKLSPTGQVYMGERESYPIVDMSDSRNVLYSGCTFRLTHKGLLPWSWFAIYENCTMSQRSKEQALPKGKYLGRSTIVGNVDLYGTNVIGTVVVNGQTVSSRQLGGTSW